MFTRRAARRLHGESRRWPASRRRSARACASAPSRRWCRTSRSRSASSTEQITVTGEAPLVERSSATVAASLDKDVAAEPADLRPQRLLRRDLDSRRHPVGRSAVCPLSRIRPTPRTCRSAAVRAAATATCSRACRSPTSSTGRPSCPSIEAVEEVRVQTKTYESDMGHSAGGVFNTTARSGSNSLARQRALAWSSRDGRPDSCTSRRRPASPNPPQYYRNWAGSLGGPIVKNRTFFWFSTDNYEQLGTRNNVLTLPTALERAGDFSQTRNAARSAGHHLRSADDAPERRRPVRPRSVSRQRHSRRTASTRSRGRCSAIMPTPDGGKSLQRRRVAARRSAAPADAQDRSALERSLDDDRHVRAAEDA